jgi:hypothetical protein
MGYFFRLLLLFLTFNSCLGQKMETVYLNPKDSTSDMYIAVSPEKPTLNGFMFLIPSFGELPMNVLQQTNLPSYAAQNGILTIIPLLKTGLYSFGVDSATQRSLKEMVQYIVDHYKLHDTRFFLGGFSIGGSCAIKFAESAREQNYKTQPTAVFGIDPPLDFERFYLASTRIIRLAKNGQPPQEAAYMIKRIQNEMGGTPENAIRNYYKISPYSFNDTTQAAVYDLRTTPIMLFTEPDIQWWLEQRNYDYSYMNSIDCAALINEVRRLGNNKAKIIVTEGKGYRQPGNIRHPHSWSIADPALLVNWLLEQN